MKFKESSGKTKEPVAKTEVKTEIKAKVKIKPEKKIRKSKKRF